MDLEEIIKQFGFNKEITCKEPNFNFWDEDVFSKYTEWEYLKSNTKEVDEVYNMSEFILLHNNTGIRFRIIYSESYYGDILDYKFIQVFVIFKNGKKSIIKSLDLINQTFSTHSGSYDFNSILKNR
jgi:hypothetical protein